MARQMKPRQKPDTCGAGIPSTLRAGNPITPPGMYIADPEGHQWADGRLYVYGSRDENKDYYCSHRYHVLSTRDLVHWDVDQDAFATRGPNALVVLHTAADSASSQSGAVRLGGPFRPRGATFGVPTAQARVSVLPCSAHIPKRDPLATKWTAEAAGPT